MPSPKKIRADALLVKNGLAPELTRAQSLIMAGKVFEKTRRIEKPSEQMFYDADICVKSENKAFASRGGLKLDAALTHFKIEVRNKICLDVGASTGGFTDCLLKQGASKVYAVDVGYGQLVWELQTDSRVIVLDRTNFRLLDISLIPDAIDIVVIDASFISLKSLIPKAIEILARSQGPTSLIALIKPQFEVAKTEVPQGGIIQDDEIKSRCIADIAHFGVSQGLIDLGVITSPIRGRDGNEEFLIAFNYKRDEAV